MIARGEWVFVLRTARNLTLQRLAHLQGGDVSDVSAELFEVSPFEPGVPLVEEIIQEIFSFFETMTRLRYV
jgi:hypothetical protein